jgi:hypothetical protein
MRERNTISRARVVGMAIIAMCACVGPGRDDYSFPVGKGCVFARTSSDEQRIVCKSSTYHNDLDIAPKVVSLGWNYRYVLAKQDVSSKRGKSSHHSVYRYWIIDTVEEVLLGPYDNKEFKRKRHEMNIPSSIKLIDPAVMDKKGCSC